jgi:thiamine pyrophosphate-dependent acetolactate synthase large subunit-like protein
VIAALQPDGAIVVDEGLTLADPPLDWVVLSGGMGVSAARAGTTDELTRAMEEALAEPGPHSLRWCSDILPPRGGAGA